MVASVDVVAPRRRSRRHQLAWGASFRSLLIGRDPVSGVCSFFRLPLDPPMTTLWKMRFHSLHSRNLGFNSLAALLAWSGAIVSLGCGSRVAGGGGGTDTSTNWLADCDSRRDCGSGLECRCGVCTRTCHEDAECSDLSKSAVCIAATSNSCDADELFCLAEFSHVSNSHSPGDSGSEETAESTPSRAVPSDPPYPVVSPPPPSGGPLPCQEVTASVESDQASVFGPTPRELVSQFGVVESTLTWNQLDVLPFTVSYTPAAGKTAFELVELEVTGDSEQLTIAPTEDLVAAQGVAAVDACNRSRVAVPVRGRLVSDDGAMNERWEGTLTFFNPSYGELLATVSVPYAGEFAFSETPYHFEGEVLQPVLTLNARLWPNGSAGSLWPEFEVTEVEYQSDLALSAVPPYPIGSNQAPSGLTPPTGESRLEGDLDLLVQPASYGTIANWPSADLCPFTYKRPHSAEDRLNGYSPTEVQYEMPDYSAPTFSADNQSLLILIDWEPVVDPMCAGVDGPLVTFDMRGRITNITGVNAPVPDTPITHLDAPVVATVRYRSDQDGLTELAFGPDLGVAHAPLTREGLQAATGIVLPENDTYAGYYWSIQGRYLPIENGWKHTIAIQVYGVTPGEVAQHTANNPEGYVFDHVQRDPETGFVIWPGTLVFESISLGSRTAIIEIID